MKHYDVLTLRHPGRIQAATLQNHFKVKSYNFLGNCETKTAGTRINEQPLRQCRESPNSGYLHWKDSLICEEYRS